MQFLVDISWCKVKQFIIMQRLRRIQRYNFMSDVLRQLHWASYNCCTTLRHLKFATSLLYHNSKLNVSCKHTLLNCVHKTVKDTCINKQSCSNHEFSSSVKYNFEKSEQGMLQYFVSSTYINMYIFHLQHSVQIIEETKEKFQYLT